jgi:hypothetical protein
MQVLLGGEVDPTSEQLFELLSKLHTGKQPGRIGKRNEEVDVAPGSRLTSRDRTEHAEIRRPERAREFEKSLATGPENFGRPNTSPDPAPPRRFPPRRVPEGRLASGAKSYGRLP